MDLAKTGPFNLDVDFFRRYVDKSERRGNLSRRLTRLDFLSAHGTRSARA